MAQRNPNRQDKVPLAAALTAGENSGWWAYRRWLAPLLIVAVTTGVYFNSFKGQFIFDDWRNILQKPEVHQLWPPGQVLSAQPHTRMVVHLSLAANFTIHQGGRWGYHAVNLAVHVLAGLTLFGIVRRTLRSRPLEGRFGRAGWAVALTIALLWAVHPLQTQSVTYIIQRSESLMGLFYLLTLYCAVRGFASANPWRWFAPSVLACLLGMATKQVMVTAPLMVLLYDWMFASESLGRALTRRWRFYAALAGTCLVLIALQRTDRPNRTAGYDTTLTVSAYILTQFKVILAYLRLSFWPIRQSLDWYRPINLSLSEVWLQAMAVLAMLAATGWGLWRRRPAAFAGAWFFLVLAPTSSIMPIQDVMVEHRMYLPLAGVIALVVASGYRLGRQLTERLGPSTSLRIRTVQIVLLAGALAGLSVLTIRRNRLYHDPMAMWGDVVEKNTYNARGQSTFGILLSKADRGEEALPHLILATRLEPYEAAHFLNLGIALENLDRREEAIPQYIQALEKKEDYFSAYAKLAAALMRDGELDAAVRNLRKAVALEPNSAIPIFNLALALEDLDQHPEAIEQALEAARLDGGGPDAYLRVAMALEHKKKFALAAEVLRASVDLYPDHADSHYRLGLVLSKQGLYAQATEPYRRTLALRSDHLGAMNNLAWLLATCPLEIVRDGPEALARAEKASQQTEKPLAGTLDTLAAAFAETGQFDRAVETARQAMDLAEQNGQHALAQAIRARLELYRRGQPYRQPSPAASQPTTAPAQ